MRIDLSDIKVGDHYIDNDNRNYSIKEYTEYKIVFNNTHSHYSISYNDIIFFFDKNIKCKMPRVGDTVSLSDKESYLVLGVNLEQKRLLIADPKSNLIAKSFYDYKTFEGPLLYNNYSASVITFFDIVECYLNDGEVNCVIGDMKTEISKLSNRGATQHTDMLVWYLNGERHRDDGPAVEHNDGSKEWWLNGHLHRINGPAIERIDGHKEWWLNGLIHREDGYAVENASGTKQWRINGKLHRLDGPAIEYSDGADSWFLNGIKLDCNSPKEFEKIIKEMNKEHTMKDDTDMQTGNKKSLMKTFKSDFEKASYRTAGQQMTSAVKSGILLMLKDNNTDDGTLKWITDQLNTEKGDAFISYLLGQTLPLLPVVGDDPRAEKLAEEFRVSGIAITQQILMTALMKYILPQITGALASLPPLKEEKKLSEEDWATLEAMKKKIRVADQLPTNDEEEPDEVEDAKLARKARRHAD